jgi:hypothetical protein
MTFGAQVRLAGSVIVLAGFAMHNMLANFIGLAVMALGATIQIDNLERRVKELEPKGDDDEQA